MPCLTEFECSVFADGEMAPREARQIEEHVAHCRACRRMVEALHVESRVLTYCFQTTDFIEFELEDEVLIAPQASTLSVTKFAGFILAMAVLVRPVISVLDDLALPDWLNWLNPFRLSGQINLLATTAAYIIPAAVDLFDSILKNISWMAMGAALLLAGFLLSRKSVLTNAMLSLVALLTVFSSSSYALDVRRGDKPVTVPPGETVDDTLVVAGNSVIIDGVVTGDLIALVREVTIRGTVKGNVVSFAQRVNIEGNVGGTVLGAGQSVQTRGQVGGNVYAFASTPQIANGARINGNALLFGADSEIQGDIAKDAFVFAGSVDVLPPARIGGNLNARVQKAENVHIESGAKIEGKTTIQAAQPQPSRYATVSFYVWQTIWLAAAFVTGLVLYWLMPTLAHTTLATSRELLITAGVGFLAVIAAPIAAVIAAITVIGLPLGLMTFVLWLTACYLAKIAVAGFLGRSFLANTGDRRPAIPLMLIAGLVPIFIAINLPYIGGLIGFVVLILGLGLLATTAYRTRSWGTAPQAA